jgi:hypothetical protein
MGVGAAVILLVGLGLGFWLGRATAPEPAPAPAPVAQVETTLPTGVVEEVATETIEPDFSEEPTESVEATVIPDTPKQRSPKDGSTVGGSRVLLKWAKVPDDDGTGIEYAFEIQDRRSNGSWGRKQIIQGLTSTSYSARVIPSTKRRWRVWAIDGSDNESKKSGWWEYTGKAAPRPKPSKPSTSSASDETT